MTFACMTKQKGCTYMDTLWYTTKKGVEKPLKPGTKLTVYCHYKNNKSVLRWGNKLFITYTDRIINDKQ